MDISDEFRSLIVSEIDFVLKKMDKSENPSEKLYYFSSIPGVIQRTFNIEYNPDLVFTHFILRSTYQAFLTRLTAIQQGGDTTIPLQKKQFVKLSSITKELARKIDENKDIDNTLKKYVILFYSTTGNGYYLQQKGLLRI